MNWMSTIKWQWKFYFGIFLIILSLVIGKVAIIFFLYYDNPLVLWSTVAFYMLSWPMLIVGIWLVGRVYFDVFKKYMDYRFYHESLKRKTRNAYNKTREKTTELRKKTMDRTRQLKERMRSTEPSNK